MGYAYLDILNIYAHFNIYLFRLLFNKLTALSLNSLLDFYRLRIALLMIGLIYF